MTLLAEQHSLGLRLEALVRLPLENGADIERRTFGGHTPLSLAAAKGRTAVLEVLLQNRAQVDSIDSEGRTPIAWATRHGHEAAALLLYERGARIVCQG